MKTINAMIATAMLLFCEALAADTPLSKSDSAIQGWATGYLNYLPGDEADPAWQTPAKALGPAEGTSGDIVCLGRGGQITLTFSVPIRNGPGNDFAVFENGISSTFLELGWVEVSSDGTHFVRFRNQIQNQSPVGGFGQVDPNSIVTGLASRYEQGIGTTFDLEFMKQLYNYVSQGAGPDITESHKIQLLNNFPYLDLNNIRYVRIVDIVGDGSAKDAYGNTIYDPYPTIGSAGFDLDAVAVLNQQAVSGDPQTITFPDIPNQKLATGSIELTASSDSGLPVSFSLIEGPAILSGSTLTFTNSGRIVVDAAQEGNASTAPAVPVWQDFHVAENLQHIWIEPVPNLVKGSSPWQLRALSDSGLPVYIEVTEGPTSTLVDTNTHLLTIGPNTGSVRIRAAQIGDATTAPAEDVTVQFDIVSADSAGAPQTLTKWISNSNNIPRLLLHSTATQYSESRMQFNFTVSRQVLTRTQFQTASSLTNTWSNAIPEIVSSQPVTTNGQQATAFTIQLPVKNHQNFYRLRFEENAP